MQQKKFKTGDIVRVSRTRTGAAGRKIPGDDISTEPTIGRIVWVHPLRIFYVVEFRDKYTSEYKPLYRQSFFPEQLERIHQPNFMKTRPAKMRSWVKQEE